MVAREKNTIHERHHTSRWQTFRWQRRRRSTEDAPRVEESTDTAREENEDLTREESQPGHALQLNQRENGTLQHRPERRHSNQEHRGPGHIRKADLAENITENTMVLDIYRTPLEHRGPGHIIMIQEGIHREHHREMIQEGIHREHHGLKGKT